MCILYILFISIVLVIIFLQITFLGNFIMRLEEIRLGKNLSVPALSGVPHRTIQDIEKRRNCMVSTAKKLADVLNVTLDEHCCREEEV